MPWARHRLPLIAAALLDAVGLVCLALIDQAPHSRLLIPERTSILILITIYCSLGWLLGSYTLLKLKTVTWIQVLARLGSTAIASISAAAVFGYLFRLQITSDLFFRSNLIPLFLLLSVWSGLVRLLLRTIRPNDSQSHWHIIALPKEIPCLTEEWKMSHLALEQLPEITQLTEGFTTAEILDGEALALTAGAVFSIVELAEQELQRIPSRWVANQWLLFSSTIDGQRTSIHKQFKRYADVLVSIILLAVCAPLLIIALTLVKLHVTEDL